jgi:hypothetical protein
MTTTKFEGNRVKPKPLFFPIMFLTIQYPITDLRTILGNTNMLIKPKWPNPDIGSTLRHFGSIGERTRGGVLQWTAEEKFCISKNAINLKELTKQKNTVNNKDLRFECCFRRFFKPGEFTCKYEIAFSYNADHLVNQSSPEELASGVYDKIVKTAIDSFLKLPVKIERTENNLKPKLKEKNDEVNKQFVELQLYQAGDKLADLYLKGSTKKEFFPDTKNWWITAGEPIALLTYINTGKLKLPPNAILVENVREHGIVLHSLKYPVTKTRFVRFWLIGLDALKKTKESIEFLRQLRINLFRINAEKESLRNVLNTIASNDFLLKDENVKKSVSAYLEDITAKLLKKVRFGIEQDKILHYALHSEELAKPGSLETLLSQLQLLENKFILKNVERLAPPEKKLVKVFVASSSDVKEDREKCIPVILKVNKSHKHLFLEPVLWEYDMVYGNFPENKNVQDAINPKLKESQLAIFIFYSRLGQYTREEFEHATAEKKKFFAFFKKGFLPDEKNNQLYTTLLEFKKTLNDTVLYKEYEALSEFDSFLSDNLHLYLSETYLPPAPASPGLI